MGQCKCGVERYQRRRFSRCLEMLSESSPSSFLARFLWTSGSSKVSLYNVYGMKAAPVPSSVDFRRRSTFNLNEKTVAANLFDPIQLTSAQMVMSLLQSGEYR